MVSTKSKWVARIGFGLIWLLIVLDVLGMGLAGSMKFSNPDLWTGLFEDWGYPRGFVYVVGGAEMVGALLLLVPRFTVYAAGMLMFIMSAALVTVLIHPGQMGPSGPIVHLVVLSIILAARWKVRWRPAA
jgi:uncharacterized membrane protein YphA (DoxX/SURF4 family)